MNPKISLFNNSEFLINNKNLNEEKLKTGYQSKYKNIFNNNYNNSNVQTSQNKNEAIKEETKLKIRKETEDFYNFEIYKSSIYQYNFGFFDEENIYKYKTISVTDSFQKKYKEIFNLDKNRSYNDKNNIYPIELQLELNSSFETKNHKQIILGKPFNNDKSHLNNIIRIFDKSHKHIDKINKKYFPIKYNHYYIYKNRINNYNYLKYKTKSKFSKQDKKKSLKQNYSTIIGTHINLSSGIIKESNNRKHKIFEKKEPKNKTTETENKNFSEVKNENEFSTINSYISSINRNMSSVITKEQNNKIKEAKIIHKENNNDTSIKNPNIPIGLNKMIIMDKTNENPNSIDINNNNRNSVNITRRFFYKYRAINNANQKSKSILEETEKNNNNQSMKETPQLKDKIKLGKIIKIENIENNGIASKKIQRNERNKNQSEININPKPIKKEEEQKENKEIIFNKVIVLTSPTNEQISIINENNINIPLNNNKRKKNMILSKNRKEHTQYYIENNKNQENNMQINFGRQFIQSHQNTSQNLLSEIQNINNNGSMKSVINSNKYDDSKNKVPNKIIKLGNMNLNNYENSIYKSERTNKSQIIFKNHNYKVINSQNNDQNEKKQNLKEIPKKDNLKTDVFKRKNQINKQFEGDKITNDKINQGHDIQNFTNVNKKNENPFRDTKDFYNSRKITNKYDNHKFHEIKSTSVEKNNKFMQYQKDKNIISYKIDNKAQNQVMANSSLKYINIRRKMNKDNKEKDADKKEEKEK